LIAVLLTLFLFPDSRILEPTGAAGATWASTTPADLVSALTPAPEREAPAPIFSRFHTLPLEEAQRPESPTHHRSYRPNSSGTLVLLKSIALNPAPRTGPTVTGLRHSAFVSPSLQVLFCTWLT
jgi:hypothetical protein